MSAEHFETILSADVRTAPDGRGAEYAEMLSGRPRWIGDDGTFDRNGWVSVQLYAHDVLAIAADTVRSMPMEGISGDLPEQREQAARIIETARDLVRDLALDDAWDGAWTAEGWSRLLARVREAAKDGGR